MKKIKDLTKEELQDAVDHSNNLSDIVRYLGFDASSGKKRAQVKKYCEKYSMDISHLIKHKGSNPFVQDNDNIVKECSICHKILPIEDFGMRNSAAGIYRAECKRCHLDVVMKGYEERKQWVSSIKEQCKCAKCGEKRSYLLDFHHLDPTQKDSTVARLTSSSSSKQRIQEEIDKCIVLCANCHREFHYLEHNHGITIEEYLQYDPDKS